MEQYCDECNQKMKINLQTRWVDTEVKEYFQQCEHCGLIYKSHLEDKVIRDLLNHQRKIVGSLRRHTISRKLKEKLILQLDEKRLQINYRMKELEMMYWSD